MIIILVAFVIVVFGGFAVWHFLFGTPNMPLPLAQVNISASGTSVAAAQATDSTSTDIANPTLPEETLSIDGATWTVELATTVVEQTRGLSYRPSLASGTGMLFIFPSPGVQNFWMKDMHFPLDMIWIGSDGTVAGFAENVPAPAPNTALWNLPVYTSPAGVSEVLEVNAGSVAKYRIQVGDRVTTTPLAP